MLRLLRATIDGLRTSWWYLAALMVVLAVMAAGVHTMTIAAAPARAWQEQAERDEEAAQERAVVPQSAAASEGLPIPALLGGIVLAFAVGLTAGQVQRRRRLGRRDAARLRPDPVPDPVLPARAAAAVAPAPAPPAPKPPAPPKIVKPAPPPPPPPPPPPEPKRRKPKAKPPEPVAPPEEPAAPISKPEPVAPISKPEPVAPPDEHVERHEPVAEPQEPVAEPHEPVAEPHEPVAEPHEPAAEPVAEPEPVEPPAVAAPPQPPAARPRAGEHALGRAPEVPRPQEARDGRREPAVSLDAPEAVGGEPRRPSVPVEPEILPGRRFARDRPWPEEAEKLWTCEIAWKAGYVKSSFRAMAGPPGGDGRRKPIGESPSLRWTLMTDPEPPTPEMIAGVKALIGALVAAGWQRTEPGGPWYAQRFLWRGQGEPGPVEVPEPAQPAEPPTR